MKKQFGLFILLVGISVLFQNCTKEVKSTWDGTNYFAQLQLDSTLLLMTELTTGLDIPWSLAPGPNNWLYFTEQKGTIQRIHTQSGKQQLLATVPDVFYRKSTGLLSMVLHPDFEQTPHLFVHYTSSVKGKDLMDHVVSKIVRYTLKDSILEEPHIVFDSIPGSTYHNGSRMLIDEGKLWIGTGDAGDTKSTQDTQTLNGKILRLHLDGSVPADNPYPNNPVWSVGHRNPQGLTQGNNRIYSSEHGPNNDDEVNLIRKAQNYGWPDVHGFCDLDNEKKFCETTNTEEPLFAWTPTIATAGMCFYDHPAIPEWRNSLLLTTLKAQSLRVLELDKEGEKITKEHFFFQNVLGRLRDVAVGSEGELYLATSNMDGHQGYQPWLYDSLPKSKGDRIIKIQVADMQIKNQLASLQSTRNLMEEPTAIPQKSEQYGIRTSDASLSKGAKSYAMHCAACHAPNGKGSEGQIPPLVDSEWVTGNVARLVDVTLGGLNTPITVNGIQYQGEMPGYQNLKDEEIRDILNFVRAEFGKVPATIMTADIVHQRKGLK